jgi:hypothetical protein
MQGEQALRMLQLLPAAQNLKQRTLGLLGSNAARDIRFSYNGMTFTGQNFDLVANLISDGRILFRPGNVGAGHDAEYHYEVDVIDVPTLDYGKDSLQRNALVHECAHAWFDLQGDDTYAPWEEAVAYIAGALFTLKYEPPPKPKAPRTPGWVKNSHSTLAFKIAVDLLDGPAYIVPALDALNLETAVIRGHDQFKGPGPYIYRSNGVDLR